MTPKQREAVSWFISQDDWKVAHHGDCIGADADFHIIAFVAGLFLVGHPPVKQTKRAFCNFDETRPLKEYIPRNHDIVDESGFVIATPGDFEEVLRSGTWATIRYAKKSGKRGVIVWPDGTWDDIQKFEIKY